MVTPALVVVEQSALAVVQPPFAHVPEVQSPLPLQVLAESLQ
jgi:hypothetical protein